MIRSSLLKAADTTEQVIDRIKFGAKWRYDLWRHLTIRPYRGFGVRSGELHLRGRVLDDRRVAEPHPEQSTWRNAVNTLHRIESDEIPGARVRLTLDEQTLTATTDEDGFFEFNFVPETDLPSDHVWHEVALELAAPVPDDPERAAATGHIIVPRKEAEFAVVSDLDDTVIRTGATSKFQMARIILLNNASTRVPFPGVSAFYRALQDGPDAQGDNPVFYVSSSPWNFYDTFQGFFKAYDLPLGPIFLKDYGITSERFFKTGHAEHKLSRIERLIETYPDLRFVLVGDSGQEDPEIYRRLVGDHGKERIQAIFIRDVTSPARDKEVHAIARQVERMGVPMFLAEDTSEAAARAVELDLITEDAAETVRREMERQESEKEEPGGLRERLLGGDGETRSVFSR
jgi:phosphatidate phosphatase APP1